MIEIVGAIIAGLTLVGGAIGFIVKRNNEKSTQTMQHKAMKPVLGVKPNGYNYILHNPTNKDYMITVFVNGSILDRDILLKAGQYGNLKFFGPTQLEFIGVSPWGWTCCDKSLVKDGPHWVLIVN